MHHISVKEKFEHTKSYSADGGRNVRKVIKKRIISRRRTAVTESGAELLKTAPKDENGQINWDKIMKPNI